MVTVVCVVTDIIIECMKIYLLLFCLYLYLSTVQFTLYINQPFIECYIYLYLSLIYIFIQCANVLSWWRLSLLYCCTCDLSTVTCCVCQFVCVFCIFRISLCINVKVWNNSLLWQPNMCTTIKNSGWNWHNVVNASGRQVEVFGCILVVKNTNHWKRRILPVAACRSLRGPQAMTLFHVL